MRRSICRTPAYTEKGLELAIMAARTLATLDTIDVNVTPKVDRIEAARLLAMSVANVRRLQELGELRPHVKKGRVYYSVADLRALVARRTEERVLYRSDPGELEAQAFELLERSIPVAELVTRLRVPSSMAKAYYQAYHELRRLGAPRAEPPSVACVKCSEAEASYCASCAKAVFERRAKRRAEPTASLEAPPPPSSS